MSWVQIPKPDQAFCAIWRVAENNYWYFAHAVEQIGYGRCEGLWCNGVGVFHPIIIAYAGVSLYEDEAQARVMWERILDDPEPFMISRLL